MTKSDQASLYIDPRDNEPFYIGKGTGNRAFSHLDDGGETEKAERIRQIRLLQLEPRIEILKWGLSDEEALLVEQTAIDLLDISRLTNQVRGHGSRHGSRDDWLTIERSLSAVEVEVTQPTVLINIRRSITRVTTPISLYDATRSAWKVGPRRDVAELAMPLHAGVIQEVYRIAGWFPAGTTMRSADPKWKPDDPSRFEFVGALADEPLRDRYVGRRVKGWNTRSQNPIRYLNCGSGPASEEEE